MGGYDLARLIQASLPLPGRHLERALPLAARPPSVASNATADAGGLSGAGAPSWISHEAHSALKRALLDQTLAATVRTLAAEAAAPSDNARPYSAAVADRTTITEGPANSASVTPLRPANDQAFALNPALNSVATELMRTLMPPEKQSALRLGITESAAASSHPASSPLDETENNDRTHAMFEGRFALFLFGAVAAVMALVFAVGV